MNVLANVLLNVLFVQGGGAGAYSEDAKLAASLQQALGTDYLVHYPAMPGEDRPDYSAWKDQISSELAVLTGAVSLVGHSFGASILLKALTEEALPKPVEGLFLLAPPYWGMPDWEFEEYALAADFASRLPELPLFFYHSRDDSWVPFGHQARYAAELPRATFRSYEDRGHQFGDDLAEIAADIKRVAEAG